MKEKTKLCKYCKEEIKKGAKNCPHCGKYQGMSNAAGCGIILIIIIFIFCVRGGCSGTDNSDNKSSSNSKYITYSEFTQIEIGMTYNEVCELVGSSGEITAQSEVGGINLTVVTWYGDSFSGSNATVYFENGAVTSKAQLGLN